jgi:hypothetical protein
MIFFNSYLQKMCPLASIKIYSFISAVSTLKGVQVNNFLYMINLGKTFPTLANYLFLLSAGGKIIII